MTLINLVIQYFPLITISFVVVVLLLVSWESLKHHPEYFFWISLAMNSFLAPLAYTQGLISVQRLIQAYSIAFLLMTFLPKKDLIAHRESELSENRRVLRTTAPIIAILIVYCYIAVRTAFLNQPITLTIALSPLYLAIAAFRKISFEFGLKILVGILGPLCILNLLTIDPGIVNIRNLLNLLVGGGARFSGIFNSNHDSAFLAGLLLLSLSYSSSTRFRKFLWVISMIIILLSGSRGVLLPVVAILVFQFPSLFPNSKKITRVFVNISGSLLFALTLIYILRNDIFVNSLTGRTDAWSFYVRSILESPLLGSGAGVDALNVGAGLIRRNFNTPHNGYLTIASFGGLFILTLFILSLLWIWKSQGKSSMIERSPRVLLTYLALSLITESRLSFQSPSYATYLLLLVVSQGLSERNALVLKGNAST